MDTYFINSSKDMFDKQSKIYYKLFEYNYQLKNTIYLLEGKYEKKHKDEIKRLRTQE